MQGRYRRRQTSVTWKFVSIVVVLVLSITTAILWSQLRNSKVEIVSLKAGWQKVQISGIVPAGSVLVVDENAFTVFPSTSRQTSHVTEGRINVFDPLWVVTQTAIWVYYPPSYNLSSDAGYFWDECLRKLSDLTGEQSFTMKEYSFGHAD